jgi:hypothetical protein
MEVVMREASSRASAGCAASPQRTRWKHGIWVGASIWLFGLSMTGNARAVTVILDPPDSLVFVGETFTLRAVTDAVSDLKAFELIYRYDASRLEFLGASNGELLTSTSSFFSTTVPDQEAPEDSVIYDAAVLTGSAMGPGILVYLHFKALAVGDAMVECDLADFRNSQNQQTLPATEDARVQITVPTPAVRATWGGLKRVFR